MSAHTGYGRGYKYSRGGTSPAQRQYGSTSHFQEPPSRDLLEGLLPAVLNNIGKPGHSSARADIEDLQCIGSYNWTNNIKPTIIVPGMPIVGQVVILTHSMSFYRVTSYLEKQTTAVPSSIRP